MELLMALAVGALFAGGTYLMLARHLLRVVLGTVLISHGANLLLLASGRLKRGGAPILPDGGGGAAPSGWTAARGWSALYSDPLPPALILTAIVIGFATTALLFALAYRTYQENGTADLVELRGLEREPHDGHE